jgi:hypothetical protein
LFLASVVNEVIVRWETVRPVVDGKLVILPVIEKLDGVVVIHW